MIFNYIIMLSICEIYFKELLIIVVLLFSFFILVVLIIWFELYFKYWI